MLAFTLLVPLAITSNAPRSAAWAALAALHRLVYVAAAAAALHFILLVKAWPPEPLIYAALVAVLLLFRFQIYARKRWGAKPAPKPLAHAAGGMKPIM